jgi:hypothetical protein
MKIYLATWLLEPAQGRALTQVKGWHRLLSFYHTKEKTNELPCYCKTGKNENLSRR